MHLLCRLAFLSSWLAIILLEHQVKAACTSSTLTDASGTLSVTYNSGEPDCNYIFSPQATGGAAAAAVHLNFRAMRLSGAEVHVYAGADASGDQIYSCISCADLPPVISVEDSSIFVRLNILSTGSYTDRGFQAEWWGAWADLSHPGNATVHLRGASAEVVAPSYEDALPPRLDFRWLLEPHADGALAAAVPGPVYLMAERLWLPDASDKVVVYDGASTAAAVLATWTGTEAPARWVVSNSSALLVRLLTDGASPSGAFRARYWADGPAWPDADCGALEHPLALAGPSMLFTDGTASGDTETKGAACEWAAAVEGVDALWLVFYRVSIKESGHLVVYEGTSASGSVLYACYGCGELYPAPIRSSSGSVYLKYFSNTATGAGYTGFEARYFTDYDGSYGMGDGNLWLRAAAGQLRLPGEEGTLPDDLAYTWYISPHDLDDDKVIILSISDLYIEDCNDQITVYDGETSTDVLAVLCDTSPPTTWIKSTGQSLRLEISGNAEDNDPVRFQASYYTDGPQYRCGISTNPMELGSPSMVFSDGHAGEGVHCEWFIDPSGSIDNADSERPLVLVFPAADMPADARLAVYDGEGAGGTPIVDCAGCTAAPPHVYPSSGKAYVTYDAGAAEADRRGFELRYFANHGGGGGGGGLGDRHEELVMPEGVLRPPATEGVLPTDLEYFWQVEPKESSDPTIIAVTGLDLDCKNNLTIYDGAADDSDNILESLCGTTDPEYWIVASDPEFYVSLQTDSTDTEGDFQLFYYTDGPRYRCGHSTTGVHTLTPFSFRFSDGSGPNAAPAANLTCRWLLQPEVNGADVESVVLVFEELGVEDGSLAVHDGTSADGDLLFSCTNDCRGAPGPIASTGGALYVKYTTGAAPTGSGFVAQYYANYPDGAGMGNAREVLTGGAGVLFPPTYAGAYPYMEEYVWYLRPDNNTGPIRFLIEEMDLDDCDNDKLIIYEGADTSGDVLVELCNEEPVGWLTSTSSKVTIQFKTNNFDNTGGFRIHWFAEAATAGCAPVGGTPATLTFPSYQLTDGSAAGAPLRRSASCAWVLAPAVAAAAAVEVVLAFSRVDLGGGGTLTVHDGASAAADVLWRCGGCSDTPPPLVSSGSALYLAYASSANWEGRGAGFSAHYFAAYKEQGAFGVAEDALLLSQPVQFASAKWLIEPAFLSTVHEIEVELVGTEANTTTEGTCADVQFKGHRNVVDPPGGRLAWHCGTLRTDGDGATLVDAVLGDRAFALRPSGRHRTYQADPGATAYGCAAQGVEYPAPAGYAALDPLPACTFAIVPLESASSVAAKLTGLQMAGEAALAAYAGSTARGQLLWECRGGECPSSQTVTSSCGKLTIVVENATESTGAAQLNIEYAYVAGEPEYGCPDETGVFIEDDTSVASMLIVWSILGGSLCFMVCLAMIYSRRVRRGRMKVMDYEALHVPHIRVPEAMDFYPRKLATMMLRHGECLICYEGSARVFDLPGCKHSICVEDMTNYLNTALGDASMFPLKCPMHYSGCTTVVAPAWSRKVLPKSAYLKFAMFHERAVLGEGMDCVFCKKFVHLPPMADMKTPMVSCPHCHKHFCMKCKIAWHIGATCEENNGEDDIENWAEAIGASKCPSCEKFIEKSDAETCNHMVHKTTDAIPCVRERTDYCYLCGTEVAPGYPHIEIDNPTVNHFPDGVFQECRKVMEKKAKKNTRRVHPEQHNDDGSGSDDSWGSF